MSTGHSYVFYDVPFMSPAQFSTGVLSIFDMSSLSCLQSLQISYFHSLHPKACIFLPPGACYLAPSTLSILLGLPEFFLIHKSKHASFLPKGPPPAPASTLAGNLTFAVHGGLSSLWSSDTSLSPPQSLSAHPVPAWERLFPLLLSSSTSSGFKIQVFPLGCFPRSSQGKWIISVTMLTPLLWIALRLLLGHMWTL